MNALIHGDINNNRRHRVPSLKTKLTFCNRSITFIIRLMHSIIQGVPGGTDQTSGECSLC